MSRCLQSLPFAFVVALVLVLPAGAQSIEYPLAERADVFEEVHGTVVHDPYRWMEEAGSPAVREWIRAQQHVTESFLSTLPSRTAYVHRLTELWDAPRFSPPRREGDYYVFAMNDGLQNQAILYRQAALDADPEVLLDPNTFSEDGTVSLAGTFFSPGGHLMAYAVSDGGSDWRTFRVLDVETGEHLDDEIRWAKFTGASWAADGSGFFYSRYDEPEPGRELDAANELQQVYFHRIGTSQGEDVRVHYRPDDPLLGLNASVTEDGQFILFNVRQGTDPHNELYIARYDEDAILSGSLAIEPFFTGFDATYSVIGNDGSTFYVATTHGAPNRRIVAVDLEANSPDQWREIIPETDAVIQGVRMIGDRLVVDRLENVQTRLTVYRLDGTLESEIELPTVGNANLGPGRRADDELFYSFTSFTFPTTILRYDFASGESEVIRESQYPFDPDDFVVEQVWYESLDDTRVPMFIVHHKDLERDGSNPTYLYGYGGFNVSMTPGFSPSTIAWLERGGVYAVPNLRGGGEFGRAWHDAGRLHNKQNVFDDFIAAAEYLVAEGFTAPQHLGIGGGSNGGLLVGAVMTQRPELFGAAIPNVGVLDMLRFHKFTIGWAWVSDYGSPDDPEFFETLLAYSPLHNLEEGTAYPATLVMTADHDDRVVPAHSFKFAAALQHAHGGEAPVLIRIEERAGHGAGTPTSMVIQRHADMWAFLEGVLTCGGADVQRC